MQLVTSNNETGFPDLHEIARLKHSTPSCIQRWNGNFFQSWRRLNYEICGKHCWPCHSSPLRWMTLFPLGCDHIFLLCKPVNNVVDEHRRFCLLNWFCEIPYCRVGQCSAEAAFLRHCRTKFWIWRSQNCPRGTSGAHWFWTLGPLALWKIPIPKITLFFTGIPVVVTAILIGVLDLWIVLVLLLSDNTYRLSLWKRVPVNSCNSDGPMKIFLTCAAAYSRCPAARSRNQQNYIRIFATQPVEKKCQDTTASETDARLKAATVRLWQYWLCT